jgi:hypothetical protein
MIHLIFITTHIKKKSINELRTFYIQEEGRLRLEKPENTRIVSQAERNAKNSKTTFKVKKHGHVSINKYDNISKCLFIGEGTC